MTANFANLILKTKAFPMRPLYLLLAVALYTTSLSAQVFWSTDVAPILYQHCTVCHHEGGIGPFSLMTYPQAAVTGPLLEMEVISGNMPPWPPDQTYSNFAHERILSEDEIATLSAWVADAMPEGDPSLAPPLPVYSEDGIINIEPDLEITMPLHTSSATALSDDYSCFSIPSELTQNKKLRAFEFVPGNPEIVHHALIFIDESGSYPTNTSGNCMGPENGLIGSYTPGAVPTVYPSDGTNFNLGVTIPEGSNIVMAMHYPHGSLGETDQSTLRLWFYPDETPIREVSTASLIQNWSFSLPPNQLTDVSAQFSAIPQDVSLLSIFPHMHLLGKSIESHVITSDNEEIPLVRINDWDFHWQQFFSFQNLVRVPSGSTIYGSGVYDNTTDNPNNPNNPPVMSGPGLNTNDEMFLIYFQFLTYQEGDELVNLEELTELTTTVTEWSSVNSPFTLQPNPADEQAMLSFDLETSATVSVYIYDLNGRMVNAVIDRAILSAGSHLERLDLSQLSSGMYVYSALVNGQPHSGRFMVK
jgi:hypothetical protein